MGNKAWIPNGSDTLYLKALYTLSGGKKRVLQGFRTSSDWNRFWWRNTLFSISAQPVDGCVKCAGRGVAACFRLGSKGPLGFSRYLEQIFTFCIMSLWKISCLDPGLALFIYFFSPRREIRLIGLSHRGFFFFFFTTVNTHWSQFVCPVTSCHHLQPVFYIFALTFLSVYRLRKCSMSQ